MNTLQTIFIFMAATRLSSVTSTSLTPLCSVNETFADSGYDCQSCQKLIVKCAEVQISKCYCNPGYVRDQISANCILFDDCPKVEIECPPNQFFAYNGFDCATCSNYQNVRCMKIPHPQCICEPGYVHEDVTGKCVQQNQCPNKPGCGKNEYVGIGPNCQSCSNYAVVFCAAVEKPTCICYPGYVRDDVTNICTEIRDCPVCPVNETYSVAGADCQTCSNYQLVDCVPINTPQCFCNQGYVHKETVEDECIAIEDCPKHICGVNEEWAEKGTNQVKCSNYLFVKFAPQPPPGCYCINDFVRHDVTNVCTAKSDCPKNA